MKKVYVFATGERVTAEISEEWAAVLAEMDRAEHANNEKHRSHRYSLDAVDFEGEEFGIYDAHPFEAEDAEAARVRAAFAMLTPTQQRRLKLYARDLTYCEIGRLEGIDAKTCYESIEAGRKKFFKYFGSIIFFVGLTSPRERFLKPSASLDKNLRQGVGKLSRGRRTQEQL